MLFRKKQPKSCEYCRFATPIQDNQFLCSKRGLRQQDHPCNNFRYDPFKRVPVKTNTINFSEYTSEDFKL